MATTHQSSLPPEFRPREKYAEDPSGKALSPVELLAIILGTGSAGCPVHELALRMIDPTEKRRATAPQRPAKGIRRRDKNRRSL